MFPAGMEGKFLSHYILFMYSEGEIPSDFLNTLLK